ncbi:hypothetical protein ES703_93661 [subsurface metagenome]
MILITYGYMQEIRAIEGEDVTTAKKDFMLLNGVHDIENQARRVICPVLQYPPLKEIRPMIGVTIRNRIARP